MHHFFALQLSRILAATIQWHCGCPRGPARRRGKSSKV